MKKCELPALSGLYMDCGTHLNTSESGQDFHVVSDHLLNVTLGVTYTANYRILTLEPAL